MNARLTILFVYFSFACLGQSSDRYIDTFFVHVNNKLYLENEAMGADSLQLKMVNAISDSAKTLIIEFKDSRTMGSVLTVKNPFNKVLSYKAAVLSPAQKDYKNTDVMPVRGKLVAIELWESGIKEVRLCNFQLAENK